MSKIYLTDTNNSDSKIYALLGSFAADSRDASRNLSAHRAALHTSHIRRADLRQVCTLP